MVPLEPRFGEENEGPNWESGQAGDVHQIPQRNTFFLGSNSKSPMGRLVHGGEKGTVKGCRWREKRGSFTVLPVREE